jgi:hypothetical protein
MRGADDNRDGHDHAEMTDAQLGRLLADVNRQLLERVEATADPSRVLTAIMTRSAREEAARSVTCSGCHGAGTTRIAIQNTATRKWQTIDQTCLACMGAGAVTR